MNVTRLSELLLYVLNRTTIGADSKNFKDITALKHSGLEKIAQVSILAPVAGTIFNLVSIQGGREMLAKHISFVGGCKIETFNFLCSFDWKKGLKSLNIK